MSEFCSKYSPWSCERWRRSCGCRLDDYCECSLWRKSRTPSDDDFSGKRDHGNRKNETATIKAMTANLIFSSSSMDERFPTDIYKYLKQHVQPSMLLKLMQICKYFQHEKFPYNVIQNTVDIYIKWKKYESYPYYELQESGLNELPNNLWINKTFFCECDSNLVSAIISKVAFFDIELLALENQNITFDEFKILTTAGKVEELFLTAVFIEGKDGNQIPMEKLFQCFPKVERISIDQNIPSMTSFDEIRKTCPPNLLYLILMQILEQNLDIKVVIKFIKWRLCLIDKKLKHNDFVFYFTFNDDLSPEYTTKLQEYVDRLVQNWKYESGHFHFDFKNCNKKSEKFMTDTCNNNSPWSCERATRKCGCMFNDEYCMCSNWPSRFQSKDYLCHSSCKLDEQNASYLHDFYNEWEIRKSEKARQRRNTKKFVVKKGRNKIK